jgi:hypothetical protein
VSLPIPEVAPVIITDNRCAVRENAMIRANGDGRMDDNNDVMMVVGCKGVIPWYYYYKKK